jgi:hypothetical protein
VFTLGEQVGDRLAREQLAQTCLLPLCAGERAEGPGKIRRVAADYNVMKTWT